MTRFLFLFLFQNLVFDAQAQKVELGFGLGLANYTGDVASSLVLKETKLGATVFARYNANNTWAFTFAASQMQVSGNDANFEHNAARNIIFKTNITEFAGLIEFNYFKYGAGVLDKHFTPYVFWGLGMALYTPKGLYQNNWVDLRSLQTEGAENAYGRAALVMPMGIGVKWMPNKRMSLEWNLGLHKSYSDYIDDVSTTYPDLTKQLNDYGAAGVALSDPSAQLEEGAFQNKKGYQRGNPDIKDWYFTTNISVTWRIFTRIKCSRFY